MTRTGGDPFGSGSDAILIAGVLYAIASITDDDNLVTVEDTGTQSGVPYNFVRFGGITGIPAGETQSGPISSGVRDGKIDGLQFLLEVLQIGSDYPGAGFTLLNPS